MLQEIRFVIRSLARARAFTCAAVLTLGVAMGANTIVYAVVDALILRPLPFGDRSHRLVTLHSTHPTQARDWDDSELSYADLLDVRESSRTLTHVEGLIGRNFSLSGKQETERVAGASVTPGLFALLGVNPQLGRGFTEADAAAPGFESVALISDGLWRRLFGADPAVVGGTVPVNGRAITVVGVMPRGFAFPERHDIWMPYRAVAGAPRDGRSLMAVGLLAPDAQLADARAELSAIAARLAAQFPDTNRGWGLHAIALRDLFVSDVTRQGLTAMLAAVGLVLLVGCANVASLLVARGMGRSQELTVRAALGAARSRIVRLLLVESLILSLAGAAVAVFIAMWGLEALVVSIPEPTPYWAHVGIDARVLGFAFLLSLLTAVASGLPPALRASRLTVAPTHLHGARAAGGAPSQRRLQSTLVVVQIAFSLSLLVAATILARSTMALLTADVGFDSAPLASARIYIAGDAYDDPAARAAVLDRVVSRVAALPGVQAAAGIGAIPGDDGGDGIRLIPDGGVVAAGEEIGAHLVPATAGFFETLGLQLIDGRTFTDAEARRLDQPVAVINQRLAQTLWPGQDALHRDLRVVIGGDTVVHRVIGIAPDVVYEEVGEQSAASTLTVYVPYVRAGWRTMAILARTSASLSSVTSAMRGAVRSVDPGFAAYDVMTMGDRRLMTTWGERFLGRTFAAFSIVAVLLACLGVYGLTAHAAVQRRREIGIRLAVGAQGRDIVRLLLGRGMRLAAAGALLGIPLAIVAARAIEGLLFRVSPWEPAVWTLLPGALITAVIAASFLPARRASRQDPARALRQE